MNTLRIFPSYRRLEDSFKRQADEHRQLLKESSRQQQELAARSNEATELKAELAERAGEAERLKAELAERAGEAERLKAELAERAGEAERLSQELLSSQLSFDSIHAMQCRARNAKPKRKVTPFFLNSNLPDNSPECYNQMMREMAGNSGNTYITYAMLKTLGFSTALRLEQHVKNVWEDILPDVDHVNRNFTHCFFTLQDQFQAKLPSYISAERVIKIVEFIKALSIPLVTYSVGTNFKADDTARNICPELKPLLQIMSEKCRSIGVRGKITQESLAQVGVHNTMVIGCPTYFETGFGRTLGKKKLTPSCSILGTGLFSTHAPNPVHFLAQSETLGMKISFEETLSVDDISEFQAAAASYPGYLNTFLKALKHNRVRGFHNIDAWKRYISESDICLAIGTRLHGSILALNCGVPALCTAGDTRAKETCEYLGIPHQPGICGLDVCLSDVLDLIDTDAINHRYQEIYAHFLNWLEANDL
jgi:hypothetical protein